MTPRRPVLGTEDLRHLRDGLRSVQTWLADVTETAESDDGLIHATVNGRGDLLDLTLDPRIYRTPDSRALATAITATILRAKEQAADRAAAHTRRVLAPDADPAFDPLLRRLDRDIAAGDPT
jgi:DNA-binding protein YbaB